MKVKYQIMIFKGKTMKNSNNSWCLDLQKSIKKNNNADEFENIFWEAGKDLMCNYQIQMNEDLYDFVEIEFYYNDKDIHNDEYTHGNERQKKCFEWYIHRTNNNGIRNGRRKGLDITFGNENAYGGVLIRAIKNQNNICAGPSLTVDQLIKSAKTDNIKEFTEKIEKAQIENSSLKIVKRKSQLDKYVYRGPRIGLCDCKQFANSLYRFAFLEGKIKDKEKLAEIAICKDNRSKKDVSRDLGYNIKIL